MKRRRGISIGLVVAMLAALLIYRRMVADRAAADGPLHQTIVRLEEAASDADSEAARDSLLDGGGAAVDSLLLALDDGRFRHPERLIRVLADLGDERADLKLRNVLQGHPDALARRAAATALAELPDQGARSLLLERADKDPALQVRQAAILALADLGDDSVLRDVAALLDPGTVEDLREAANDTLEVFADQDFHQERGAADAWLDAHGAPLPRSSVGGAGRGDGSPLVVQGAPGVRVERHGAQLVVHLNGVGGAADLPMNLLLQMEAGRILIELSRDGEQVTATCIDAPVSGRALPRHAPIPVTTNGDSLAFSLPRVGQLVAPDLPRSVHIVRSGSAPASAPR